jgi:hypothetical protein
MMGVMLGTETAWKVYRKGDLVASFQWLNDDPAMFIYPVGSLHYKASAFVLPLQSAHKWALNDGHPNLPHAVPTAANALNAMGMLVTRDAVRRFIDLVLDGIADLIAMPPEPRHHIVETAVAQTLGELRIEAAGRTVVEGEAQSDGSIVQ